MSRYITETDGPKKKNQYNNPTAYFPETFLLNYSAPNFMYVNTKKNGGETLQEMCNYIQFSQDIMGRTPKIDSP
jgi:hypothetical protein